MKKKGMGKRPRKIPISFRLTKYDIERLRQVALGLDMKPSEYISMILNDANDHFLTEGKTWTSQAARASRS